MKPSFVTLLRDPETKEPLSVHSEDDGQAVLRSAAGAEYPIEQGVPVVLRADLFAEGQKETADSFAWKWAKVPGYRTATIEHYRRWFLERYGFATEAALATWLSGKRMILDAGTAHGRDAEMYAKANPEATVIGIDITSGVMIAERDLGQIANLHFAQADLTRLPFAEASFDYIGCDQVIHHTPNTRASLGHLVRHLQAGGHIAFYVYRKKGPVREFCDDHLRQAAADMTPEQCWEMSEALTRFGKALSDMKLTIDVPEDIPLLGIKAGEQDLQRFIYWTMFKCYWNDTMDWESNVITNFDWYHPLHAHRHTEAEVRGWCADLDLTIEHIDVQESGISVLARRGG